MGEHASGEAAEVAQARNQCGVIGAHFDAAVVVFLDMQFKGAQLHHFIEVTAYLGVLLGQRRHPPVREGVADGKVVAQGVAAFAHGGKPHVVRPCDVLVA